MKKNSDETSTPKRKVQQKLNPVKIAKGMKKAEKKVEVTIAGTKGGKEKQTNHKDGKKKESKSKQPSTKKSSDNRNNSKTQHQAKSQASESTEDQVPVNNIANSDDKHNHLNDSDGEHSWSGSTVGTKEDDANTISSDKTSKVHKGNTNNIVLPQFTRYQIMILLDQNNSQQSIAEDNNDEKSPTERVLELLAKFTEQTYKYDPDANIMSWKTDPEFYYMNKDEFPQDPGIVAQYFQGYRHNLKADRRLYLRVSIQTPNSQTKLFSQLSSWMNIYGYSISKCIIQSETSTCIGWLVYSSQYTDTEPIKRNLIYASKFEWGFKMIAVTKSDEHKHWLKRARAVGVYVPTPMKDMAVTMIGEFFEAKGESEEMLTLHDKFLFMQPERMYKGSKSQQIYYTKMVDRHIIHTDSIVPEITYGIKTDLDRCYHFPETDTIEEYHCTLKDIIFDLKVETKDNPMYGCRLFHSVDYFPDSSNLWVQGEKCAGGALCIFTYYEDVAIEASTMIKGLGRMIYDEHDSEIAGEMFTLDHFKASKGYKWLPSKRRFSTPHIRHMKANQRHDNNLRAIHILQLQRQKKEEEDMKKALVEGKNGEEKLSKEDIVKKASENIQAAKAYNKKNTDSSSVDSQVIAQLRSRHATQIARIQEDPDLEDADNNSVAKEKPRQVSVSAEDSVASSLTNNTNRSVISNSSNFSYQSASVNSADYTLSSKTDAKQMSTAFLIDKIAKTETEAPLTRKRLERMTLLYQEHKFNELVMKTQAEIEKYVRVHNIPDQLGNDMPSDSEYIENERLQAEFEPSDEDDQFIIDESENVDLGSSIESQGLEENVNNEDLKSDLSANVREIEEEEESQEDGYGDDNTYEYNLNQTNSNDTQESLNEEIDEVDESSQDHGNSEDGSQGFKSNSFSDEDSQIDETDKKPEKFEITESAKVEDRSARVESLYIGTVPDKEPSSEQSEIVNEEENSSNALPVEKVEDGNEERFENSHILDNSVKEAQLSNPMSDPEMTSEVQYGKREDAKFKEQGSIQMETSEVSSIDVNNDPVNQVKDRLTGTEDDTKEDASMYSNDNKGEYSVTDEELSTASTQDRYNYKKQSTTVGQDRKLVSPEPFKGSVNIKTDKKITEGVNLSYVNQSSDSSKTNSFEVTRKTTNKQYGQSSSTLSKRTQRVVPRKSKRLQEIRSTPPGRGKNRWVR